MGTWAPAQGREPATIGIEHGQGPRVVRTLADRDVAVPEGWRVAQDHARRGLVVVPTAGRHRPGARRRARLAAAGDRRPVPVPRSGRVAGLLLRGVTEGGAGRVAGPSGSRPCRTATARRRPRRRGAWAPCSRPAAPCSGPPARRASARSPGAGCTTAVTALPQRSSGTPDDQAVVDRRVGLEDALDLLGEDLLAAGVDAHRAPAQQLDGAVGVDGGHVAGDQPAPPSRSTNVAAVLLGIVVVAERAGGRRPAPGRPPGPGHHLVGRPASSTIVGLAGRLKRTRLAPVRPLARPPPAWRPGCRPPTSRTRR